MKVKTLINKLKCYDENENVVFKICEDIGCESLMGTADGGHFVNIDSELKVISIDKCEKGCSVFLMTNLGGDV